VLTSRCMAFHLDPNPDPTSNPKSDMVAAIGSRVEVVKGRVEEVVLQTKVRARTIVLIWLCTGCLSMVQPAPALL